MSADVNFISYNGPLDNGRSVDLSDATLDGSNGYSDTVKCSTGLSNFVAHFGKVISGKEDALDVNNLCRDLDITATEWVLQGSMGFTIKGGSSNVRVSGMVTGYGKETDVDIGNASDQSHAWVTGTVLNLWRADRKSPIRVRVLGGDLPTFVPGSGPYEFVFPWRWTPFRTLVVKTFLQLRRWGLFKQA